MYKLTCVTSISPLVQSLGLSVGQVLGRETQKRKRGQLCRSSHTKVPYTEWWRKGQRISHRSLSGRLSLSLGEILRPRIRRGLGYLNKRLITCKRGRLDLSGM